MNQWLITLYCNELSQISKVCLPLVIITSLIKPLHRHSRTRRLLSLLRRIFPRIPPVSVNGPSGSRTTHHIDTSNTLYVHRVSCDKRTYYVCYLRFLLTDASTALVTIDILPDDVLLFVFHFVRVIHAD